MTDYSYSFVILAKANQYKGVPVLHSFGNSFVAHGMRWACLKLCLGFANFKTAKKATNK